MSKVRGCLASLALSNAARIAIHDHAESTSVANTSDVSEANRPLCIFSLYINGCNTDEYEIRLDMPLGSCAPDGHGGSFCVPFSGGNVGNPWVRQAGPDGCPTPPNSESAWLNVYHFPTADGTGQPDHDFWTSAMPASEGPGQCGPCIAGLDRGSGCFALLTPEHEPLRGHGEPESEPAGECAESLLHAGWECYDHVMWAHKTGIHQHPEWYPGLTSSSSIEDFHRHISQLPERILRHGCPPPCYQRKPICSIELTMSEPSDGGYSGYGGCRGSLGFVANNNVCTPDGNGGANIVRASGVSSHDVCPSLSGVISVTHFDNPICLGGGNHHFESFMDGQCMPGECCNEDASRCDLSCTAHPLPVTCEHISPDSDCAGLLHWAMTEDVISNPVRYAGLTASSSIWDFQRVISTWPLCSENGEVPPCYGTYERCPVPCA